MDTLEYDLIVPIIEEYIGDELTWEDLRRGYAAFFEDEQTDNAAVAAA